MPVIRTVQRRRVTSPAGSPRVHVDRRTTSRPARVTAVSAVVVSVAGLLAAVASGAASASTRPMTSAVAGAPGAAPPTPPPKVTQGQVSAAAALKQQVAQQVGTLSGQVAEAEVQLEELQAKKELAEQKVAYAVSELHIAQAAATAAKARVAAAQNSVNGAHTRFVEYVQQTYTGGQITGLTGSLLTAKDPSALLERSVLEQYEADSQAMAIGTLQKATIERSNAEAASRRAVRAEATRKKQADAAEQAADAAVGAQQQQEAALLASLSTQKAALASAQLQLATLNHQRARWIQYQAYLAYQRKLAAERAARLRAEAIARAEAAARARAEAEAAAAAAAKAAARHHHHSGSSGSNSTSSGGSAPISVTGPSAPTGGTWTAAAGRRAAQRAISQIGVPYAWAGGGVDGPSYGVCDPSNGAPNDCNVDGYDCSGLVMYAWGRNWAHYAATQYSEAGSLHPSPGNFKPGDLLFWSSDGTVSGIEHVAIYIGDGNVVQAPESGELVRTTPWDEVEYGYFGATRPLT